ncbi:hypothetical protein GGS26DRAFT_352436 [Hypomontagnella submonticulosa]|nr:hypothetical protein GGS26DRAFT_352436 [Hypomontagnella submonticulosa]
MRLLALPTSLLLSITLQTQLSSAAIKNDFSAYPQGSQQCLNDAADQSKCSGNTGTEMNQCLCSNQGNFIYNTAECVAKKSPNDLDAVYDTMENNCAGTGVTIAVSKQAFLSQAQAATATTSSTTPTATTNKPDPTKTADADSDSNKDSGNGDKQLDDKAAGAISTGAKIGLGVGISFGAVALGLLTWFVFMYSRRRKRASAALNDPSHRDVELSPSSGGGPGHPYNPSTYGPSTPAEYAQHNGQFGAAELGDREWKELPAGYYDGGGNGKEDKRASGVPLLAELGVDDVRTAPSHSPAPSQAHSYAHAAELPADVVYGNTTHTGRDAYRDQGYGPGRGGPG